MKSKKIAKRAAGFAKDYRVTSGKGFRLADFDPSDTGGIEEDDRAKDVLLSGVRLLAELQEKLYAQDRQSLLLIFQAMDAAGKDGDDQARDVGHQPAGLPGALVQGAHSDELDHDFLWRTTIALPERGRIGIFNRSYYEEVLVVRVHPELLERSQLPKALITKRIWDERFQDIRSFERHMARNGTTVLKFFLHVSKKEQQRRFPSRLDEQEKNWKFSLSDMKERGFWGEYQKAYEDMIRNTATAEAPWYVVPADNKWYTRLVVAAAIIGSMQKMDLHFPVVDAAKRRELAAVRRALLGKKA
jgi:PPK2 family polyphosphate:nucleotide phosphotransferase